MAAQSYLLSAPCPGLTTFSANGRICHIIVHREALYALQLVFDDPLHVSRQHPFENGEERWQTIDMAAGVVLLRGHTHGTMGISLAIV